LIYLPLLKYRGPHKNIPIIELPPENSPPADNLPVNIRPARAAAKRADFCR